MLHGHGQTFEQAVADAARRTHAIGFAGETVVFRWASRASLPDYACDRDGATQSHEAPVRVRGPGDRVRQDIDMASFTAAIPQLGPLVAKITIVTATAPSVSAPPRRRSSNR